MQLTICSRVLAALCFFFYCSNLLAQDLSNDPDYTLPTANCSATVYTGTNQMLDGVPAGTTYNQNAIRCDTIDFNNDSFSNNVLVQDIPLDENGNPVAHEVDTIGQGGIVFSNNTITNKVISTTFAINTALQAAGVGIEFRGFRYEWEVKKPDANSSLEMSVTIYGDNDQQIYGATYNYDGQQFVDWTSFTSDHPPPAAFTVGDDWKVTSSMSGNGQDSGVRNIKFTFAYAPVMGHENDFDPNFDYGMSAYDQACAQDPTSDANCPGYQEAYTQQQCTADALYDPSCDGYDTAYYNQQCTADALYDSACPGYESAYTAQQCDVDQSYDPSCPYYNQSQAKMTTPGMNVSGQGSDYIFIFRGNNPEVFATLQANLANLIDWMWECTSGAECGDNQVGYIKDAVQQGDDYIFLYTEDIDGNVIIPQSGKWYEFIEIDTACSADGTYTQRCTGYADTIAEQQFEQDCNVNPQSSMMCNGYQEEQFKDEYDGQDDYSGQDDGQYDGTDDPNVDGQFDPNMSFDGQLTDFNSGIDIQSTTGIDVEAATGIDQEMATGIDDSAARGEIEVDMQGVIDLMGPDENGDPFDLEGFENGPTGMPSQEEIAKEQAEFEAFFEESDSFGGAGLSDFTGDAFPDAFEELPTEDIFSERPLDTLEPLSEEQFEAIPELLEEAFEEAVEEQMIAEEMAVEEQMIAEEMAVKEADVREELAEKIEEELAEKIEEELAEAVEELAPTEEIAAPSDTPVAPRTSRSTDTKQLALDIASEATTAAENTAASEAATSASDSNDSGNSNDGSGNDDSSNSNGGDDGSGNNDSSGSDMGDSGSSDSGSNTGSDDGSNMGNSSDGSDIGGSVSSSDFGAGSSGGFSSQDFDPATGEPDLQTGDAGIGSMTGDNDAQLLASSGLSTEELTGEIEDLGSGEVSYSFGNIDATVASEISSLIVAELNQMIIDITKRTLEEANDMGEPLDEVSEEELEAQQELEDDLVEKAIAGDDSEDAQAALLGYNPNFRQYVQPQMPTNSNWYGSDGIYTDQQNYDNPSSRFFSGASDETHQKMVRQQYERK